MSNVYPLTSLSEVLVHNKDYISEPEPKVYKKLSVKLYGKGVVLDTPVDGSTLKMKRHQLAKQGQVILSEIWGKRGAIGLVPPEGDGALCTSHFFLFDPVDSKIDRRYLQTIFTANYLEAQLGDEARGTTGYAAVRPKHLLAAKIPLPPLDEQRRIVAKIEALAARIEAARGLRQGALEEAEALYKTELSSAYDIAVEIAGGTEKLGDLSHKITDGTHKTPYYVSEGVPFISIKDMSSGVIKFNDVKYITREDHEELIKRCHPEFGDILLTKIGSNNGFAKVIDVQREFSIFVSLALIKIDKSILLPLFVEHMLNSPRILDLSLANTRGVGYKNLVLKFIREYPIPVPPLEKQHEIVEEIRIAKQQIDELLRIQSECTGELDALLPSILDRAFNGDL